MNTSPMKEKVSHKPPLISSLLELRAPLEAVSLLSALPILRHAPKGDGQPVLVLPGFMTGDSSTFVLRRFLDKQGYTSYPWEQGRNPGLQEKIYLQLEQLVEKIYLECGQKVGIVGWSLGGIYARILGHKVPKFISKVITLGSPFALNNSYDTNDVGVSGPIVRLYERLNPDLKEDKLVNGEPIWEEAPPVPSSSIYSKSDGIASWKYCLDVIGSTTENIKVSGSHSGLTHNPFALYIISERLSQAEGHWKPFDKKWYHRLIFRKSTDLDAVFAS